MSTKPKVRELTNAEFARAISHLPNSVGRRIEWDWVRSHPAMARKARQRNPKAEVVLTNADLFSSSNGPCPSKSAANLLGSCVNDADRVLREFHLQAYRATTAPTGATTAQTDDDELIAELRDFLAFLEE